MLTTIRDPCLYVVLSRGFTLAYYLAEKYIYSNERMTSKKSHFIEENNINLQTYNLSK